VCIVEAAVHHAVDVGDERVQHPRGFARVLCVVGVAGDQGGSGVGRHGCPGGCVRGFCLVIGAARAPHITVLAMHH
jgi:hypothetical protein